MMPFIFRLLRWPLGTGLIVWGGLTSVLWFMRYFGYLERAGEFVFLGYCGSLFFGHLALQYPRTISVLRSISKSIASFWGWMLTMHLTLIAFNLLVYLLVSALMGSSIAGISVFHLFWTNLIVLIFPYVVIRLNPERIVKWSLGRILRTGGLILAGWLAIPIFTFLYIGSPSFGYAFFTLILFGAAFLFGDLARTSFYKATRLKLAMIGLTAIVLIGGASIAMMARENPDRDLLVDILFGGRKAWKVSDLDQLKTAGQWEKWYRAVSRRLQPSDALSAFQRLESFCRPKASDKPLEIKCMADRDDSTVLSQEWKWPLEESKILLESESEYAQIIALLWIRRQKASWPSDLELLIASLSQKPGKVSVVAQTTLEKSETKGSLRLLLEKDPSKEP